MASTWILLSTAASLCADTPAVQARLEVAGEEIPRVDLDRLSPRTRQRVERLQSSIEELVESGTQPAELAAAFAALGRAYFAFEYYREADRCFARAQELDPEAPSWSYYRGMAWSALARPEAAAQHFRRALERAPEDVATRVRLARVESELGNVGSSRGLYESVLVDAPESAAAHAGLGELAAIEGKAETAVGHLQRALSLMPEATSLHYQLAQQYRVLGDLDAAREHLDRRGSGVPGFPDPLGRAIELERVETAFGVVEQLAADVDSLPARQIIGFALAQFGDVEGAIEAFERGLAAGQSDDLSPAARARMQFVLGALHASRGDAQKAWRYYEAALLDDGSLLAARTALAWAMLQDDEPRGALEQLDGVLAEHPDDALALKRRAEAHARLGDLDAALEDLKHVEAVGAVDAEVLLRRADLLEQLGRRQDAAVSYEEALEFSMEPADRALAERRLGALLVVLGREQEAVAHFRRALELDSEFERVRLELGATLLRVGDPENAVAVFREARERDAGDLDAWLGEASALLVLGRGSEARDLLELGLARLPDAFRLQGTLARLLAAPPDPALRDGERALTLATELVDRDPSADHRMTLAMALAAAGRYEQAAALQETLVRQAETAGNADQARRLAGMLEFYRRNQPCCGGEP